ncbi:MAG: arsenic resistance N-acetyltransferase ArsN2, partial [Gemmatimonadales bacterium]
LLWEVGFEAIGIEPTRVYEFEDARAFLSGAGLDTEVLAREVGGRVMGAFIRARKPVAAAIRSATIADHRAVLDLLEAAGLPLAGVAPALHDFYVAEIGGRVVGAVGLEPHLPDALLRSAVVEPGARGTGLGVALVERLLDHAREQGVRAVYLLTTTAEAYFLRFGFQRFAREDVPDGVRTSVEFREACPASATVMRKVLSLT